MHQWVEVFMRRSMREMHQFLKAREINMGQYSTLMRLHHDPHCGVTDVGGLLGISKAAASQLVDKLVQQRLVERTEAEHDRRVKQLTLTKKGRALIQASVQARLGWAEALGESLLPERRAAIIEAMQDMVAAAQGLDELAEPAEAR
jgi:DNA-binding MarR family transcriptional regulator